MKSIEASTTPEILAYAEAVPYNKSPSSCSVCYPFIWSN